MANVWDAIKKHQAEEAQRLQVPAQSTEARSEMPPAAAPAPPAAPAAPPAAAPVPQIKVESVHVGKLGENGSFSESLVAHHDRGGALTEEYRALRTSLLAQCPDERFCYLVTSADAGEGKTVTAANLALVMAERVDRRTILIDCDLRKRKLAAMLNGKLSPGMVELLRGTASFKEVIQPTVCPNLFFIPPGEVKTEEVGELMGRPELDEIVSELRRHYDYMLFDTPPINVVSDAGMLGRATGGAILVVRMNKTHRESVDKAVRLLHAANVNVAGMVLTHRTFLIPNYLYRYS